MVQTLKKTLSLVLVMAMTFLFSVAAYADGNAQSKVKDSAIESEKDSAIQTIDDAFSAIDNRNWNAYIELQCSENQADLSEFISNSNNQSKHLGLFDIKSAKVKGIKEIPLEIAAKYSNIDSYRENYSHLAVYLVGVNYSVNQENKYYFNGVNYNLMIMGREDGNWRIIESADAPIESLIPEGYGFNNSDEQLALKIVKARIKGTIINSQGNSVSDKQFLNNKMTTSSFTIPYSIQVYRVSQGVTQEINFDYYCKNVLPNEWYSSWPTESLKAGAEAVKMYGWYHVLHPKYASLNADVKDTSVDQVYKSGTAVTSTTNAINSVAGVGLKNSSGNIFEAQYISGSSGTAGSQHTGKMLQYGTKYLAEHGYSYLSMCHYYYDNSNKSTGAIATFSY